MFKKTKHESLPPEVLSETTLSPYLKLLCDPSLDKAGIEEPGKGSKNWVVGGRHLVL